MNSLALLNVYITLRTFPGGKRDEDLILPINSSLSVTLSQDQVNCLPSHLSDPISWLTTS